MFIFASTNVKPFVSTNIIGFVSTNIKDRAGKSANCHLALLPTNPLHRVLPLESLPEQD